jgi:hypothetical protein
MLTSALHSYNDAVSSVSILSAFLKHLNMGTLALALFFAFALFNTTRGKESEIRVSAPARDRELQVDIRPCDTSRPALQEVQRHKFTAKDFGNKILRNR